MIISVGWMRYLLVLVPAIGTLLLALRPNDPVFFCLLLLLVWLIQLRGKRSDSAWDGLLLYAEIGFAASFSLHYGGILFASLFSSLMTIPRLRGGSMIIALIVHSAAFNVAVWNRPAELIVLANLAYAVFFVLLYHIHTAVDRNKEIEGLYDELRRKHYELDELRRGMAADARKVEYVAQLEERNRISREIHDELGHRLIRVKMMMEAALRIVPEQSANGMNLLVQVRDQLAESMDNLRSTVRRLKPDDSESRSYSLSTLIDEASRHFGIRIDYRITGAPYLLYPSEEVALYRNTQEAITNSIRHGQATEIDIHMHYEPRQITYTISNNGKVPGDIELLRPGLGLSGMKQRLQLFNGKLLIHTQDRFTITAIIPHYAKEESS